MLFKKKILILFSIIFANIVLLCNFSYAAKKQSEIVKNGSGDLAIMFSFDKKNVDINFISPSGVLKTNKDPGVLYEYGDLWSAYRIENAEAGTWIIEYDLEDNSSIEYSLIEENAGIWLQYINIGDIRRNKLNINFEADYESENVEYNYDIYALNANDKNISKQLYSGVAVANENTSLELDISNLSSGEYILKIDIYYEDENTELFDNMLSSSFEFQNMSEPSKISNYYVSIDVSNHALLVDWDVFSNNNQDEYNLTLTADDNVVYSTKLESSIKFNKIIYPKDAKNLVVDLTYRKNDIWSKSNIKYINLEEEYINTDEGDVSNVPEVKIYYKTAKKRKLLVSINSQNADYSISDSGELSFDINDKKNKIYAKLDLDNNVSIIIEKFIYLDILPPSIKLYEDLDGKTFTTDNVTLLGKISGANLLKIDNKEIPISENGEFSYDILLAAGENIVQIDATDVNGNTISKVLTLYKNSNTIKIIDIKKGWKNYLPLFISLFVSLIIIILSIIFMKKKKNNNKSKLGLILFDIFLSIIGGFSFYNYINLYNFNNSIKYLELAEKSAENAYVNIKNEKMFLYIFVICIILIILSIIISIIANKIKNIKLNKKNKTRFCRKCGKEIDFNVKYCTYCGEEVK